MQDFLLVIGDNTGVVAGDGQAIYGHPGKGRLTIDHLWARTLIGDAIPRHIDHLARTDRRALQKPGGKVQGIANGRRLTRKRAGQGQHPVGHRRQISPFGEQGPVLEDVLLVAAAPFENGQGDRPTAVQHRMGYIRVGQGGGQPTALQAMFACIHRRRDIHRKHQSKTTILFRCCGGPGQSQP